MPIIDDYPQADADRAKAADNFNAFSDVGGAKGDEFDHPVRYMAAEAATGSRYAVFVSPLPAPVEGGNPGTHVLVTLYSPRQAAWVFGNYPGDTTIERYYIIEKLCQPAGLRHAGDIEAVCLLVGKALDRQVVG